MEQDIYELVKNKSSIITTIQAYLDIRKKGNNYVAICPFHPDTNPSMSINTSMNIFKCFVCGVGGNPISFVKKYNELSKPMSMSEAVIITAKINNIVLPKDEFSKLAEGSRKELSSEAKALDDLANFYRMELKSQAGIKAMEYLKNRMIDDDVIEHFGIGYAPKDSSLSIRTLREKKKYDLETLDKAGIIPSSSQSLNDRYSERIMFPIKDRYGHTIGFSGRKYLSDDPSSSKYINTPETDLFKKGTLLYNVDNAINTAKKDGYVYVLEGYMDVIALYRVGINSAIALMGTNISEEQMNILKGMKVEVRLCLDSDNPGKEATKKWLLPLVNHQIPFKIVQPFDADKEGKDSDEVLDKLGKDYLIKKLNFLSDPITYSVSNLKHDGSYLKNLDTVVSKLSSCYVFLSESEKRLVEKYLADESGLDASEFHQRLSSANKLPFRNTSEVQIANKYSGGKPLSTDRFSCQSNIMNLARKKDPLRKINNDVLYVESMILCRLPLSYDASNQIDAYKFRFSSSLLRLIAKFVQSQYKNVKDGHSGLDDSMLDKAKTDLYFHMERQKDDGIEPMMSEGELDDVFTNLGRLMPNDYKGDSFSDLLKKHDEKLQEIETYSMNGSIDDLVAMKREQMKSRRKK